jgi:hypothetical protein
LSDVVTGTSTSRGGGPRYLLVSCYAIGGLVGAVVLALLVLLAVDGHPLPLLAAAAGALLPFPLRGIAYLLGFPHPVRGRILSTSAYREARKKLLADDFEWAMSHAGATGLATALPEPPAPFTTFWILLAHLVTWYKLVLLRIQLILGSPRATMTQQQQAVVQAAPSADQSQQAVTDPTRNDLNLVDLTQVINIISRELRDREQVYSIVSNSHLSVRYLTSRADARELWAAVFEAALDESPETLELLLNNIRDSFGTRSSSTLEAALSEVGLSRGSG